jgi:tRNA-modifying protein YgfZ
MDSFPAMASAWRQFLFEQGARFDGGRVIDFGDPALERGQVFHGNIIADLSHYGLIEITGKDAETFLATQFTSDVRQVSESTSQLSAWCTPQGRVLAVFRIFRRAGAYYLLLPGELLQPILRRLRMYILRSDVRLADASSILVRIGLSGPALPGSLAEAFKEPPTNPNRCLQDNGNTLLCLPGPSPRFIVIGEPGAAKKLWLERQQNATPTGAGPWTLLEILAGIPSVHPKTTEAFLPQMLNLEALGGLCFSKGCYPGQEIIARLRYRGQLKRRLYLGLANTARIPEPGDEVVSGDSEETQRVGTVVAAERHPQDGAALLAVLEIGAAQGKLCLYEPGGPALILQSLP